MNKLENKIQTKKSKSPWEQSYQPRASLNWEKSSQSHLGKIEPVSFGTILPVILGNNGASLILKQSCQAFHQNRMEKKGGRYKTKEHKENEINEQDRNQ